MKRRHLWLVALSLIISICMCFSLAACNGCGDDDDGKTTPVALTVPVVSIDTNGVATWEAVPNASGYAYKINDGEEKTATNRSVTLTDKQSISVKAVGDGENYTDSAWSQAKTYNATAVGPVALGKPVVSIKKDSTTGTLKAEWNEVTGATGYSVQIKDKGAADWDAPATITLCAIEVTEGQSIRVKAIGDGTNYTTGDWSDIKTAPSGDTPVHDHDYVYTDNKDGTHSAVCKGEGVCDEPIDHVKHTYDREDNTKCVCGAVNSGDTPVHDHDYVYTDNKDGTHSAVCKGEGVCDEPIDHVTHTYDREDNTKCVCGAVDSGDDPAPEFMSHADFLKAEKGVDVKVTGVVTGIAGKSVYFQDKDGGYYAYNLKALPEGIAIGKTIIVTGTMDNYNGLQQVKEGTAEVTDAETKTVAPLDITDIFKAASGMDDEALLNLQSTLVTIKGVMLKEVTDSKDRNYPFAIGEQEANLFINSTQCIDSTAQTALKALFKEKVGETVDITGFVSVFNTFQLVPAPENTLVVYTNLATPELTLDEETGTVTWVKDENASKYAYRIGDGGVSYIEKDDPASVSLEDGDTVTVWAVGEGKYLDSAEATKAYTKIKLDAPVVSTTGTGAKWNTVPNASGYGYRITPAEGADKEDTTDKLSIKLDNGDTIVVWAIGTGKYKNSDESNSVTYTYTEVKIDEPTFTIDRNGKVTIKEHHDTESFKYVIGAKADLDAAWENETIGTGTLAAIPVTADEIVLTSGQAITVIAVGNGTNLIDSDWTVPEEYKAPAGAFDAIDAEDVEIALSTTEDGKVDVTWLHENGETYEIVLDGTPSTLTDSTTVLDFTTYTEIKIKVLATEPEEGSYDYSACHNDSEYLDITDSFNAFVLAEKTKIANAKITTEKDALTLDTKVQSNKEITLPAAGATHTDVAIAWEIEGGNTDIAKKEGNKLIFTPTSTETTVKVIASLTCDVVTTPVTKEFTITVKTMETTEETFVFGEMEPYKSFTANKNNLPADEKVIKSAFVTVTFGGAGTGAAWNESEQGIRAYANNTITVTSNGTISKIVLTYKTNANSSGKLPDMTQASYVETKDAETGYDIGTWTGSAKEVTITVGGTAGNISVVSIAVTYETPSDEDIVNAALLAMENFTFADKYTENFFVDEKINGLPITWSANPNTGHGSISISETAENGKYTAIIDPSTEGDKEVKLFASVTSGAVTKSQNFTIILAQKIPAAISVKPNVNIDEDGNVTWAAVANAESYTYQLKTEDTEWTDGTETIAYSEETHLYSVPTALTDGQSIRVKAVGDGYNYSESGWTENTYIVGTPPHSHNYEWVDNGDGTHKQHCDVEGCPAPDINSGDHVYDQEGNTKCVCGAVKAGDPITVIMKGKSTSSQVDSATTDNFSFVDAAGSSVAAPDFIFTITDAKLGFYAELRMYAGCTFTISSEHYKILSIKVTFSGSYNNIAKVYTTAGTTTTDIPATNNVYAVNANNVSIKNGTGGQTRFTQIEITYEPA